LLADEYIFIHNTPPREVTPVSLSTTPRPSNQP